jgi:hypothetical protein
MQNLFDDLKRKEVKTRIAQLRPDSQRLWGKMNGAQALAHCAAGLELALGERTPPRMLIGRIVGPLVKPRVLGNDEPLRRNCQQWKVLWSRMNGTWQRSGTGCTL